MIWNSFALRPLLTRLSAVALEDRDYWDLSFMDWNQQMTDYNWMFLFLGFNMLTYPGIIFKI